MRVEFVLLCVEQMQIVEEVIIMSQQEMNYGEMDRDRPGFASSGYAGIPPSSFHGEKLSGHAVGWAPTAGQRLVLAITSLVMLMVMTFGLIGIAVATHAPPWVVLPILFILVLFSSAAVIINVVFNRKP
jgi:hypothetical protein